MGSTVIAPSTTTDISVVRQKLLVGKLADARHELYVLSDEGACDASFFLAKSVVTFLDGKSGEAFKLLRKAKEKDSDDPLPGGFEVIYGQLLVEGAICKLLIRDTRADLVEKALIKAEQHLANNGQREQAAVTTYIDILDYAATSKHNLARELHEEMTNAWSSSTDVVIQSWKRALDTAILRLLCRRTRLADRLFASFRGQDVRYEDAILSADILASILRSDISRRAKWRVVRIFILGRTSAQGN